jgi:hypothetical protein
MISGYDYDNAEDVVGLGKSKLLRVCKSLAQPDGRSRVHVLPVDPAILHSF